MKALSIGRDQACDIVVHDSTDVISRRHAILNISSSGKMTIVDQSRNGTYVNGIRISPNVPVPVTRKDIVSLAHIAKLDWNSVPVTVSPMRYIIMGGIALLLIVCGYFAYQHYSDNTDYDDVPVKVQTDSIDKKESNVEKPDSVDKGKADKEKSDSIKQDKKKETAPKDKVDKKNKKKEKKESETKEANDSTNSSKRSIG